MDIIQLQRVLKHLDIRKEAYTLDRTRQDETYCIEPIAGGWCFFYMERGQQSALKTFNSEDEACQYLLERVLADSTL